MGKTTVVRVLGAAMMAVAIAPWLGGGVATAAPENDSNCATRPAGVPETATCVVLDENTGTSADLHGETWAWRDADNNLHVNAYPLEALDAGDAVQLCVRESGPYDASFKCLGNSADRVYFGASLTLVIDLDDLGITPTDPAYYSIHVNQGGKTTVSSGNGGTVPTTTTTPPETTTTTATTSAPATTTTSAPATTTTSAPATTSVAATTASTEVSVLPVKIEATDEETEAVTAVEGTKTGSDALAATGFGLPLGMTLALSFGLLLGGAALLLVPGRLAIETGRHRRRH